jgi:hypothetical protein
MPLWERALDARRAAEAAATVGPRRPSRKGWGRRLYPVPKVGQVFGGVKVTGEVELPEFGRRDRRFHVVCVHCGATGTALEYNLRDRPPRCAVRTKKGHP